MGFILAVIVAVAVLGLEIAGTYKEIAFLQWMRLRSHTVIAKIMVAFLSGFIVFAIFTDKVPMFAQRISIIVFSLLLIIANLFLGKEKKDEM